jgi:hypothetical protein
MKNRCILGFGSFVISQVNAVAHFFLKSRVFRPDYGISILFVLLFLLTVYYKVNCAKIWDFNVAYYPTGRIILENPEHLYISLKGFVNLPILAYLFTPFSLLSEYRAATLFTILGVLSVFAAGGFLIKLTNASGWRRTGIIALLATSFPVYDCFLLGNTTHFVLLLLLGVFFCLRAKRTIWGGVLLASAALIKIPLLFLIVYLAMRGRWRMMAAFALTLLTVVGCSLLLLGLDLNLTWFNHCILTFSNKAIAAHNVQSVDGFLIRLLTNSPLNSWIPIEVGWEFKVMRYAMLSLLIGGTLWVCWHSRVPKTSQEENLEFSSFLCLSLLISPISWTHYYLFLLLPFSLYVGGHLAIPHKWRWSSLMLLSIVLIALPPVKSIWFNNPVFTVLARGFLVPHYFWGGVLLLGILLSARWRASEQKKYFSSSGETLA